VTLKALVIAGTETSDASEGPKGHPFSFSEDDFSPVRRAVDPLWDDTSTDESYSTGNPSQDFNPSKGVGVDGLPGILPAVSPSLGEDLQGEGSGGVFTLEDEEAEGEGSDPASVQLPGVVAGSPRAPAPVRRVSYGMVRGMDCVEGLEGTLSRRASEPAPGNSGGGSGRASRKASQGGSAPSRLASSVHQVGYLPELDVEQGDNEGEGGGVTFSLQWRAIRRWCFSKSIRWTEQSWILARFDPCFSLHRRTSGFVAHSCEPVMPLHCQVPLQRVRDLVVTNPDREKTALMNLSPWLGVIAANKLLSMQGDLEEDVAGERGADTPGLTPTPLGPL